MGFPVMDLEIRPFARTDFAEYGSWFADPDLNRNLGPMDDGWLEPAVSGGEVADDETWAVLRDGQLVAVVEALVDTNDRSSYMISAAATKPALRGQGIGTAALKHVLDLHKSRGILKHAAKVSVDNTAGQRCAAKAGFVPLNSEPDQYGYIELRRRSDVAA
jgi:RimJ/RimL family protein N-acetyltransferase